MTTICLIGNSHVATLKLALPGVAPDFPGLDTIFFVSDGVSMELDVVSGKLSDVMDDIERIRSEAREQKGWIMDTYMLRRPTKA